MGDMELMQLGISKAHESMMAGAGGPFGAVIVSADNHVLAVASNQVLMNGDPTAHAEIQAIRATAKQLGTHDLSGCKLYATGYPCPMCLGAIIWANIKEIYVSGLPEDADEIGFRDDYIYDFIRNGMSDVGILKINKMDRKPAQHLYEMYKNANKEMY